VLGFFSFTEVTDPSAHRAYNEWHQLDHMPEQFSLDGISFGQRWVCTPACAASRVAVSSTLKRCHYVTLYLMRDAEVLPGFTALGQRLYREGRFFAERRSHLSGPFEVEGRWVSPRIKVSAEVVPFRPAQGIYVVLGPAVDGATLVSRPGVAGAWAFARDNADDRPVRHITVAFVDGDLPAVAADLGQWCLASGLASDQESDQASAQELEWAGPLERVDADCWDWFDRLTPQ